MLSNDFLTFLIKISVGFEVLTAIIGIIFYNKYKNDSFLKYFIFLISYVAINEVVGLYIKLDNDVNTTIIYNIYNVINFTYLFFLYRHFLVSTKRKKIVLVFALLYIVTFIINGFIFENYLREYQRLPYIVAAIFLLITIIYYFIEILYSEKVLHAKKNLLFWISVGFLIYFVGNLPFRILSNYYTQLTDATILFLVKFTLTMILNTCFIIGFIWSDKK